MVASFEVTTNKQKQVIDITEKINSLLSKLNTEKGTCNVFVTHTTAAITTGEAGEGTDEDLLETMRKIIPDISFRHAHDPNHAWSHMASSLLGSSLTLPFENNKLLLGTWQRVLFLEFDGPRNRTLIFSANE